jgi:hypothetical protein
MDGEGDIICISDTHGNLELLKKGIKRGLELSSRQGLRTDVILLGDHCDNGPQIPDLLEWLSTEQWKLDFPHIVLRSILGNHVSSMRALDTAACSAVHY